MKLRLITSTRAEPGNLEVDTDLMKKGLEEALKRQLNSIYESFKCHSMELVSKRIQDYLELEDIAKQAEINVDSYSFKFERLMDKMNMAWHRPEDKR